MARITVELPDYAATGLAMLAAAEAHPSQDHHPTPETIVRDLIDRALADARRSGFIDRIPGDPMDDELQH